MDKPTVILSFDGVLHSNASGWKGAMVIPDPPVPGMAKFVKDCLEKFDVEIASCRLDTPAGSYPMRAWLHRYFAEEFGDDEADEMLSRIRFVGKSQRVFLTISDRAIRFDGTYPDIEELLAFKTWMGD